ncbi:MAG: acyl-CoA dehydrogenase family protein [Bacillota bacterium]|nr:acyl-CoA dehydrogenase family protein [Bacillota bacterium]
MSLRLSPDVERAYEQMKAFVETYLQPLEDQLPPFAQKLAPEKARDVRRALEAEGLVGWAVPKDLGGHGLGIPGLCAAREALAHTTLWSLSPVLGSEPPILLYQASPAQKEAFLLPTLKGERHGAFALTEPEAGSDAGSLSMEALPVEGGYLLTGTKVFISFVEESDYALVFARVPAKGVTLFLVDLPSPGLEIARIMETMGGARVARLEFQEVFVPTERRMGEEGEAFALAQHWFDVDRIALQPPICIGASHRALSLAAKMELLSDEEMGSWTLRLEAARALMYRAAQEAEEGRPVRHQAAMVKSFAVELALSLLDRALDLLGPQGYSQRFRIERYRRDIRRFAIAAGTLEIQNHIIARGLLKGYSRPLPGEVN